MDDKIKEVEQEIQDINDFMAFMKERYGDNPAEETDEESSDLTKN